MKHEQLCKLFIKTLMDAFATWIKEHKEAIGEKWYKKLQRMIKREQKRKEYSIANVMGTALWIFNILSNFGVMGGLAPNKVTVHEIPKQLDVRSTMRVLHLCSSCLSLQYLRFLVPEGD